jgi:hypothetical protein
MIKHKRSRRIKKSHVNTDIRQTQRHNRENKEIEMILLVRDKIRNIKVMTFNALHSK